MLRFLLGFLLIAALPREALGAHRAQLGNVASAACVRGVESGACDEAAQIRFTPSGNRANRYTLQLPSDECLEASSSTVSSAPCASADAQRFDFEAATLSAYRIRSVSDGTYLTVESDELALRDGDGADDRQLWTVQNQDLRDPAVYGRWSGVFPWPHIAVSAANLPDGRVLTFSGSERETWPSTEFTYSAIYDPADGSFTEITHATHNMFCAHLAMTADGNVFVNGGRNKKNSPWTSLFDYSGEDWVVLDNMASGGRWYPTTVALTDGDMLTSLGTATNPRNPERWDAHSQTWRVLSGINYQEPILDYPFGEQNWWPLLHLAPQGMLFHSGPTPTVGWVNPTGNGRYEDTGLRVTEWYPKHGTTVMYGAGKLITAGGWIGGNTIQSSNKVLTVDLNGPTPVIETASPMGNARKFHNGVILPDGRVAVVGGNTSGRKFNDQGSVHSIEIWDPVSGAWFEAAEQTMPRTYHSVALLLPDGRVLSAGGGYCSGNTYCSGSSHRDGELYSPAYLFNPDGTAAVRPEISEAPGLVENGSVIDVTGSAEITRFTMVRMGATTHGLNTDVRFLPVDFDELESGRYRLRLEKNPNNLTPGYWMLFALNGAGVPSIARMVQVTNLDVQFENIGLGGRTRQSSIARPDVGPDNALDGDLRTIESSATTLVESEPFWEVDLYSVYALDTVRIWQGEDALGDFAVVISDAPFPSDTLAGAIAGNGAEVFYVTDAADAHITVPIHENGRFLRVQRTDGHALSLAEVQIFGESAPAGTPGLLHYDYYEGRFDALPNFNGLSAVRSGSVAGLDLAPATAASEFAIRYYGRITVAGGPMEFALRSRDGSRLFIDGELVIEHDGVHSASEAVGARSLSAGAHDIVVEYFNRDGEAELSLRSRVAGGSFTPVPPSAFALLPSPGAFGGIEHSWWEGIGGGAITDLTAAPDYPDAPTGTDIRSRFETPTNRFDNGGARLRGFLSPPISGTYRFWIASDDSGELWLSTDESPDHRERIAHVPAWTASQEWEKYPEQASASVFLHSGRRYYVDALMKEGTGGDNLAVAWESPVASRAVIDGAYLSPPITELELLGAAGASPQVGAGVEGEYTADAIGDGVTYLWSFGDGSGDVFSESPTVTHRYDTPGRYVVTVMVRDVWGRESTTTFVQSVHLPLNPAAPAASSTIAFHPDRAEVWSVNPDNDSVTVIDANGRAVVDEIFVAAEPRSITIASDGRVWVASAAADTLSVIDPSTSALVEIPLETGAHPRGLVASRHSNRVFVALEHRGEVVEFDGDSLLEEARETLVPGIRELALDGDDAFLLVSRFVSPPAPGESGAAPDLDGAVGEVYRLAASPLASLDVIPLGYSRRLASEHSGPGMPNYLRAPAFSPDGSQVFVPSKQDNIGAGISRDGTALSHDHTVRAISSRIVWPDGLEVLSDRIDHDNASIASAAVFGPYGLYLFTALEGNREVAISDAHLNVEIARIDVGRAPQGLTLSPTGRMLFVHNFMDRTVSVLDLSTLYDTGRVEVSITDTIRTVTGETLGPDVLLGKQLFYDARDPRLALESYMSCAACHNAGGEDGRVWDFTGFGEGLRNTITLQGRGAGHGLLHWSANFDEVQDFENQIRSFAGGTGLMTDEDFAETYDLLGPVKKGRSADLDALAAYLASLDAVASPPAPPAGFEEGRRQFVSAGCNRCHAGPQMTDSPTGALHDVGTLTELSGLRAGLPLTGIDTPSLLSAWNTPPYLHDGSAQTLREAIHAHTGAPDDVDALVMYLSAVAVGEPLGAECVVDADCDNALFCDGRETCGPGGQCEAGVGPDLDDGVRCTLDTCDEELDQAVHVPNSGSCSDGLFCNGPEVCSPTAGCQPGAAPVLDDGIACTVDACDEAADTVTHTPVDCTAPDPEPEPEPDPDPDPNPNPNPAPNPDPDPDPDPDPEPDPGEVGSAPPAGGGFEPNGGAESQSQGCTATGLPLAGIALVLRRRRRRSGSD